MCRKNYWRMSAVQGGGAALTSNNTKNKVKAKEKFIQMNQSEKLEILLGK